MSKLAHRQDYQVPDYESDQQSGRSASQIIDSAVGAAKSSEQCSSHKHSQHAAIQTACSESLSFESEDAGGRQLPRNPWSFRLEDVLAEECQDISQSSDSVDATQTVQELVQDQCVKNVELREPLPDIAFKHEAFVFQSEDKSGGDIFAACLFLLQSSCIKQALKQQNTETALLLQQHKSLESLLIQRFKSLERCKNVRDIVSALLSRLQNEHFKPNQVQIDGSSASMCLETSRSRQNAFVSQALRGVAEQITQCKCGRQATFVATGFLDLIFAPQKASCSIAKRLADTAKHNTICSRCGDFQRVSISFVQLPPQLVLFISFTDEFSRSDININTVICAKQCGQLFDKCSRKIEYRLNSVIRKMRGSCVACAVDSDTEQYIDFQGELKRQKFQNDDAWVVALSYELVD